MGRSFELEIGGQPFVVETGQLAQQANGSVLVRYGDTVVLVCATMSKEPREGIDFFPLLVDYEEKMYSIGKVPGGWGRREGRPSEQATLSARMIDRALRPLFPAGFRNDVQVVVSVLSVDKGNSPTIAGMLGASLALHVSDIPFSGPVAGIRVGKVNDELVLNPLHMTDAAEGFVCEDLDLIVAGTQEAVLMVEAGAKEIGEEEMLTAMMLAYKEIQQVCRVQDDIRAAIGKPKREITRYEPAQETAEWVKKQTEGRMRDLLLVKDKGQREAGMDQLLDTVLEGHKAAVGEEQAAEQADDVKSAFESCMKEEVRRLITAEGIRADGRSLEEIRQVSCEVGMLPRAHGSGLFTRGQTQVLTACTLGLKSDEQMLDTLSHEDRKRYIHHYNFPAYSVGEVRPMRGPGRREIGHGALAERALLAVVPSESSFPYTIRLVSEVLESNGSTSQASVCGSTLALMDAGVPITKPVAGIAMGLVKYGDDFAVLTDIQGMEDALGDMDFKVAGTRDGITALQMDIKISGVSEDVLRAALEQAKSGRLFILDRMEEAIAQPRTQLSTYAPRILTMNIPVDKIRDVIGPGGKTIRKIIEQTGVDIDIEDDGRVYIASVDGEAGEKAYAMIEAFCKEVEPGKTYLGVVKRVMNFGAFVEILPGKEGLVHISQLARRRVNRVEDVLNIGDEVLVKVTEIDRQGRVNLSRKDALGKDEE